MPPSHTPRAPQRIASLSRSKPLSTTQGRASSLNHNIIIIIHNNHYIIIRMYNVCDAAGVIEIQILKLLNRDKNN